MSKIQLWATGGVFMELRCLISFVRVAQHKSYSKAAQALHLSQPTVTAHINELEKELGVRLFQRYKSPVQITEIGEVFLKYAKHALDILKQAEDTIDKHKKGSQGSLSLSLSESVFYWLMPYIDRFKLYYPLIDIKVNVCLSPITIDKLTNGEIDLGVIKTDRPFFNNRLFNFLEIGNDEAVVIFSPHNNLADFDELDVDQLKGKPTIIYGGNTNFWEQIAGLLGNDLDYNATVEMNNSQAIKLFLIKSDRIAFMPKQLVQSELDMGILVSRPIKNISPITRYSLLLYRNDIPLSDIAQQFLKFLEKK